MKKTYIIPTTLMVAVQSQAIIAFSVKNDGDTANLKDKSATSGADAMVKGSRETYNVWDDDWSNN